MKKSSKPAYQKIRKVWIINPRTRVKPARRVYKRSQEKVKLKKEIESDNI